MEIHNPLAPRTYTMDHPPLARLASRANENRAPHVHLGNVVNDGNIESASKQYDARKFLFDYDLATREEVLAESCHYGG